MKKKTLLFDAFIIAENLNAGRGRSGTYFVAYNILKNIIKSNDFDVSLYTDSEDDNYIDFFKQNFGKNIKIYLTNKYCSFLSKMSKLDKKLREKKHNILRLFLNILIRKPVKFFGKNVKLPFFDIVFSPMRKIPSVIKAEKKYIFLHDAIPLIFPLYYPQYQLKKYWFYNLVQYIKAGNNCKYFANSISTKNDFIKLLNINPDDISVAYLAASDNFYHIKIPRQLVNVLKTDMHQGDQWAAKIQNMHWTEKKKWFGICITTALACTQSQRK